MIETLLSQWHSLFGENPPAVIVRAPGRINIIGEHTDYNEGWVLPGAIDRCLYILMSPATDGEHHWVASDLNEEIKSVDAVIEYGSYTWAKYIEGAIQVYGKELGALRIIIGGNLPVGAGISSSSALVCGVLYGLQQLKNADASREEIALLACKVERELMGLHGGIMDQFAIMLCEPSHVILLDCRTRKYEHIPVDLPGCRWVLLNTKVKHALLDSDYNTRSAECRQAVALIQQVFPDVRHLRDVTIEMLEQVALSEVLRQRAVFVIQENSRVHATVDALRNQDAQRLGLLLSASHAGLRDDYQVSCGELDFLANLANTSEAAFGGRMMGGGFGGCVICLVKEESYDQFIGNATKLYEAEFGFAPDVIDVALGGGVSMVKG